MPTYAQLNTEAAWRDEFDPPALAGLKRRLREKYGDVVWTKGDNRHVRGRHRSRRWCLTSAWSKSRTYGTRDPRDLRGDENWLRALDHGIKGPALWAACRRVDAAVRAGELPGLAEWFGTFDGRTVVGWFEGRPGSSDDSHLTHGHYGFWTESANDQATMDRLYDLITGEDDVLTPDQEKHFNALIYRVEALFSNRATAIGGPLKGERNEVRAALDALEAKAQQPVDLDALAAKVAELLKPALVQAAFEGAQRAERE